MFHLMPYDITIANKGIGGDDTRPFSVTSKKFEVASQEEPKKNSQKEQK